MFSNSSLTDIFIILISINLNYESSEETYVGRGFNLFFTLGY